MDEKDWLARISGQYGLEKVVEMNKLTEKFGLVLSEEDAKYLVSIRQDSLKEQQRIEFGEGILPRLIFAFCDSPYIDQNNYVDTMARLQEIFYLYKNESMDLLTDEELLEYMRESFDDVCQGSLDYLEDTALEELGRKIREEGRYFFGNHYKIRGRESEDE